MELEFRAFHKEKKIMCQVLLICFVNKYVDVLPDYQLEGGNQEEWKFDEIELMAYTGLKDVSGTKIFEGDILDFDEREWGGEFIPEVVRMEDLIGGWGFCGSQSDLKSWRRVIGNIYMNPEILTQ